MAISQDSFFKKIDKLVRTEGFAFLCIGPDVDAPPYAYTVGLTETYGCPELLIFGVGQQTAGPVFHTVVDKIKAGARFSNGDVLHDVLSVPCAIKAVSSAAAQPFALNVASRYKDTDQVPTYQQLVYPDASGIFPWEAGYDKGLKRVQTELWETFSH